MKKIKYNPRLVKRTVLFTILGIIVFWFGFVVVSSFFSSTITSDSSELQTTIPAGEYRDYLLETVGMNASKYEDKDLEEFLNRLEQYKPTLTEPIKLSYADAAITAGGDGFVKDYSVDGGTTKGYYTDDSGELTWTFQVDKAGFYYVMIDYVLPSSKDGGSNAERSFKINGKELFDSLASISFNRLYCDDEGSKQAYKVTGELKSDLKGNNLKPSQVEITNVRREEFLQDATGYVADPYLIYLEEGQNEISISSIREKLVIYGLSINQTADYEVKSYEDYYNDLVAAGKKESSGKFMTVEPENSLIRVSSTPTLYPISDRNSSANTPNDPVLQKYNAIGGSKWSSSGDWVAWNIEVEEAGFYNITFRAKQDQSRGLFTTRKLLVNGEVPFKEAENCRFYYSSDYQHITLGDTDGNAFKVYLEAGSNEIRFQATVGDYADLISQVQIVVDDLNDLYLRIISITTANPDEFQDYKIYGENSRLGVDALGRTMEEIFEQSAVTLNNVSNKLAEITGEKSTFNNTLDKLVLQIGGYIDGKDVGGFATNPRNVTKDLSEFKSNLSSLGTWILDIKNQSLTIESFYIYSPDAAEEMPNVEDNFFVSTWFAIKGFIQSFFFDYEAVGETVEGKEESIEVWFVTDISSGREQANALKSLIDQTFIPTYNVNVILKVVNAGVLLPATLAGTGPDVAINVEGGLPVNYALRSAVYNMAEQEDFGTAMVERFTPEQLVPFTLRHADGSNGVYGLPNTMSFYVMFYRTDIFEKNGWAVPTTWDEVIDLVTDMQVSNLEFFMPLEGDAGLMFATLLYQAGGKYYTEDQTTSAFNEEVSLQAFERWCSFFTDYSFELSANFSNRFRSGEMPIGISSYTLFNTLAVFAPDIAGKWAFAPLPGTYTTDTEGNEVLNTTTIFNQTAVVIMRDADYENSWEFVKWWTSTETQTQYAKEMESILGSAARHNTANRFAVENLAWSKSELQTITTMWDAGKGIPGVPGGYYVGRNLENSIRAVINQDANPRETFKEYIEQINAEITRKRDEFGLPTA